MNHMKMKTGILLVLLSSLSACGEKIVEFKLAGGAGADGDDIIKDKLTPPVISATMPVSGTTGVHVDASVTATFSKKMDAATLTATSFTVLETVSKQTVTGTLAYDAETNVATFVPDVDLKANTDYTATVGAAVKDLAGNALVVPAASGTPNPWIFKTALAPGKLALDLGGIATFGIAARAGLNSTGVTVVNGDVALSPTASCTDATGGPGSSSQSCLVKTYATTTGMTVNGSIYFAADPFDNGQTASDVTNDLNTAWLEGRNNLPTQPSIAAGELGGKTFIPGVYSDANLTLAAGTFATLDAQDDADAVFIFKVDSDIVDSGTLLLKTSIKLVNGAQARNVWFIAGRDITLGSGTTWNGNILAGRDATVNDGATVMGRVLAGAGGAGAITLTGAASPSVTSITVPQ